MRWRSSSRFGVAATSPAPAARIPPIFLTRSVSEGLVSRGSSLSEAPGIPTPFEGTARRPKHRGRIVAAETSRPKHRGRIVAAGDRVPSWPGASPRLHPRLMHVRPVAAWPLPLSGGAGSDTVGGFHFSPFSWGSSFGRRTPSVLGFVGQLTGSVSCPLPANPCEIQRWLRTKSSKK